MALALEKSRLDFIGGFPSFAKYNTAALGLLIGPRSFRAHPQQPHHKPFWLPAKLSFCWSSLHREHATTTAKLFCSMSYEMAWIQAEICCVHHQVEDLSFRRSHIFHHKANARGISEIQHWATEAQILSAEIRMLARRGLSEESSGGEAAEVSASVATHHAPDSRAIKPYHMQSSALVLSPPTSLSTHSQMDVFHALLPTFTPAENKALKQELPPVADPNSMNTNALHSLPAWSPGKHESMRSTRPRGKHPKMATPAMPQTQQGKPATRRGPTSGAGEGGEGGGEGGAHDGCACRTSDGPASGREFFLLLSFLAGLPNAALPPGFTNYNCHSHQATCQVPYGYPIGIGDGESVESAWALTATPGWMGPGVRRDKLDDGYAEWSHLISTNRVHMPNK
ncbi:hypothetical protein DFH07DRAFT_766880 [Mycena maculata]|uniref:Uncharacterized protein n=1 Tax=Mycena maculata TaxID=230809 RepID=A0AAD7K0U6_9AGAR|nr:hypothetical protein DFH07DRAFT_766880 [Mycena maculata]